MATGIKDLLHRQHVRNLTKATKEPKEAKGDGTSALAHQLETEVDEDDGVDEMDAKAEIEKYACAAAHFKRFQQGSVHEEWTKALAEAKTYWEERSLELACRDFSDVAMQARTSFDAGIAGGVGLQRLGLSLACALARFAADPNFRQHVDGTVDGYVQELGPGVTDPVQGRHQKDADKSCKNEVMRGAIAALQRSLLITSGFTWSEQAAGTCECSMVLMVDDLFCRKCGKATGHARPKISFAEFKSHYFSQLTADTTL